jgi:hypothetical protein
MNNIREELATSTSVESALDIVWGRPTEMRVQILTFWWLWWCNRNKLREGDKTMDAAAIAHHTRCSTLEYMEVLGKKLTDKPQDALKWTPPEQDVLKFNSDGAFTPGSDQASWGVIARDHRGETVIASAGRSERTYNRRFSC